MPRPPIDPFLVMEILGAARAREAAGAHVLHLEVGQPAGPAPAAALAAARAAIDAAADGGDPLGYTPALGLPALRTRVAQHYLDTYGVSVDDHRVAITVGASGAAILALLAGFGPGDRVGVLVPGYPCYRTMLTAFGCTPVTIRVDEFNHWRPDLDTLDAALPLDGLVIAGPSNPTGTRIDPTTMAAVSEWARHHGVRLVSDEIYHGIEATRSPTAATDPQAVVIGSFSKYFSMTGWRVGWLVLPDDLVEPVDRLAQNLFLSPPAIGQHAALGAFDATAELDALARGYDEGRRIVLDGLARLGVSRVAPAEGAFYVWAETSGLSPDSRELCRTWLEQHDVAVTPGVDFDPEQGHHWVRFSVAGAPETLTEAMERLQGTRQ